MVTFFSQLQKMDVELSTPHFSCLLFKRDSPCSLMHLAYTMVKPRTASGVELPTSSGFFGASKDVAHHIGWKSTEMIDL